MLQLKNVLKQMIEVSEEELEAFAELCYKKVFKRKALLSQEAKFITEVYFIKKGIIRNWFGIGHTVGGCGLQPHPQCQK